VNKYEETTSERLVEKLISLVAKSHEQMSLLQMRIAQLECAIRETQLSGLEN